MLHLDFESRSEVDLTEVGTWRYTTHPSTEVLMLGFSFGKQRRLWEPHLGPMPDDLRQALEDPWCPLAAWHSQFERLILWKVLGIPTELDRWVDPMVMARFCSMPGSLEKVANILKTQTRKMDTTGVFTKDDDLKKMFCEPLRMGGELTLFGVEPTTYRDWDTHVREWERFREYCMDDVAAEEEIHEILKEFDLPDWEYEIWRLDQQINDLGMYVDPVLLQGATLVVERARADLRKKLNDLTQLRNVNSNPQILKFVRQHGYTFGSIGKAYVKRALAGECNLDDVAKDVLHLRSQLSKTAVNKLESCRMALGEDGRIHHILSYYGAARTGRWSGSLLQPQNLVKPTKEVDSKMDRALELLKAADYDTINKEFSSALDVASAALRPILRAKPGFKLAIADLNAIESRGAAWISDCDSLAEVFRNGRDPYCAFAALLDPTRTYEDFYHEWKVLGKKTNRTNAKPATLGCFGKYTEVITDKGIKRITDVSSKDKVWDGEEWVSTEGCAYRGEKQVINLMGVEITPEHEILVDEDWREAWELYQNIPLENRAINLASGKLLEANLEKILGEKESSIIFANVPVDSNNGSTSQTSKAERLWRVRIAPVGELSRSKTESMLGLSNLEISLIDLRTVIMRSCLAVEESVRLLTGTAVGEFSANLKTYTTSLGIAYLSITVMNLVISLIEEIITATMRKEMLGSSLRRRMLETKSLIDLLNTKVEECQQLNSGKSIVPFIETNLRYVEKLLKDFLQNKLFRSSLIAGVSTFDLINCGARNRFTILTDRGPLIVHNCAYGLSGGEITEDDEGNEVKSGLLGYADSMGIELEPEFAQKCVDIFRNAYPEIPATWYSLQDAFARVVEQNTIEEVNHVTMRMKGKVLCITLPSGRDLHYINPRTHQEERKSKSGKMYKATVISYEGINQKTRQWERVTTWGGKIFENIVQAVCRDILAYGMLEADREGFSIVLHVHDEIVAEVPETGKLGYEKLVECMCRVPFWCPGFLIGAEGFESEYYSKN